MIDTIIRGGLVVAPDGARLLDIAITGEQIAALIEPGGSPDPGATVIDATDKIVIPGGIDPHAHSSFKFIYPWAQEEGIVSGSSASVSRACAWGGTTTFVDFANWGGEPDLSDAVKGRNREFSKNSYVDYSFHIVLSGMGDSSATDLGERLLPSGPAAPRWLVPGESARDWHLVKRGGSCFVEAMSGCPHVSSVGRIEACATLH